MQLRPRQILTYYSNYARCNKSTQLTILGVLISLEMGPQTPNQRTNSRRPKKHRIAQLANDFHSRIMFRHGSTVVIVSSIGLEQACVFQKQEQPVEG